MRFIIILSTLVSFVILASLFPSIFSRESSTSQQAQVAPNNSTSTLIELGLDKQLPTHFLERSSIRVFNKKGILEQQLSSDQIQYLDVGSVNERIILLQPTIRIEDLNAGNLYANSSRGELNMALGELYLQGSVYFQQQQNEQQDKDVAFLREFRSNELMIDSQNKIARTKKSVQIIQQGHYIDGVGMKIDLDKGIYQLHSQVGGIHHVN